LGFVVVGLRVLVLVRLVLLGLLPPLLLQLVRLLRHLLLRLRLQEHGHVPVGQGTDSDRVDASVGPC
jgi:hypothetical protein